MMCMTCLRYILVGVLVPAGHAVVALPQAAQAQEAAGPVVEARIPRVTVAQATEREFLRRVPISGTLVPRQEALVYPEIGGYRITELTAEVGDRVEAGEVVAQLEDRTLRSEVARAEAELARAQAAVQQSRTTVASAEARLIQARQTLERTRELQERGTTTQAALDEAIAIELTTQAELESAEAGVAVAEAQFKQAETALEVAKENLETTQIRSPVSGLISARSGQLGATASATGDPIYRVIRDGTVEVEAEVIETNLGLLSVGAPAQVEVSGIGEVRGRIRAISPRVDATSRLGTVQIEIDQREGLRPGVYAGGWITVDQRTNLAVPASAVITDPEGAYVLRVKDGLIESRSVTPGLIWQDWREIVSGLNPGDNVVATAGAFFDDGDRVEPVMAEEPRAAGGDVEAVEPGTESP